MKQQYLIILIVLASSILMGCAEKNTLTYECPKCDSTLFLYGDGSFYVRQDMPIEGIWEKNNNTLILTSSVFSWRLDIINCTTMIDEEGDYWTKV